MQTDAQPAPSQTAQEQAVPEPTKTSNESDAITSGSDTEAAFEQASVKDIPPATTHGVVIKLDPPPALPNVDSSVATTPIEQDADSTYPNNLLREVQSERRRLGHFLGFCGVVLVIAVLWLAGEHLSQENLISLATTRNRDVVYLYLVKTLGHAFVSVAAVYFAYQMLKTAERMILPPWLVNKESIELMKTLLGIDSPADGAGKLMGTIKQTLDSVQALKRDDKDKSSKN